MGHHSHPHNLNLSTYPVLTSISGRAATRPQVAAAACGSAGVHPPRASSYGTPLPPTDFEPQYIPCTHFNLQEGRLTSTGSGCRLWTRWRPPSTLLQRRDTAPTCGSITLNRLGHYPYLRDQRRIEIQQQQKIRLYENTFSQTLSFIITIFSPEYKNNHGSDGPPTPPAHGPGAPLLLPHREDCAGASDPDPTRGFPHPDPRPRSPRHHPLPPARSPPAN